MINMIDDELGFLDENGHFICNTCGSSFDSENELIRHLAENNELLDYM